MKVQINGKEVYIDMYIIVKYGYRIPEVSWEIQEKVKKDVEEMSGMKVAEVNIHIQAMSMNESENSV